jgi:ABC-type branched-subunit amino acid transport system ATPase component
MLEVMDLHAGYGRLEILKGISLRIEPDDIVGIIGPNGAGKSTLLKAICGFLRPTHGSCRFQGAELVGKRPDQVVRTGLAYVPQTRGLFPQMTVHENLMVAAHLLPSRAAARAGIERVYARFSRIAERRLQRAGTLSGGERRLLEVARVLVTTPRLILLDEPSAALAPRYMDEVYRELVAIHADGVGLVIVEQNVNRILEIADRVVALELGRAVFDAPPQAFREGPLLRELFLGLLPADDRPRS